jgi:hypothetical protein
MPEFVLMSRKRCPSLVTFRTLDEAAFHSFVSGLSSFS